MTGGEAVIASLVVNGARLAFGIPGKHNLALYDALVGRHDIRQIVTRNEQGASLMANGAGRWSGEPGICLVTTGPGACNALVGVADAARESVPMLVIASQISAPLVGLRRGAFHEMEDQAGMFAAAGAWIGQAHAVADIPGLINAAWVAMTHGRPRPALVEIPQDVLSAHGEASITAASPPPRPAPSSDQINAALTRILAARRPLIYAGAGAVRSRAGDEIRACAERLAIPVMTTVHAKGVLAEDHPQSGGILPTKDRDLGARILEEADLLLALGTGFSEISTAGWGLPFPSNLIHVDIDGAQIGRNVPTSMGIVADVRAFLAGLNDMAQRVQARPRSEWADWSRRITSIPGLLQDAVTGAAGAEISRVMRSMLPRDAVIVGDAARWHGWQMHHLPTYQASSLIIPLHFGTLGYGVPAAIGVKAAAPQRTVVAACGDGGFLFCSQELATAVQHELPLVVVLVNNNCYGTIKMTQERTYGPSRVIAADLKNPDFVAYASALGCFAQRVDSVNEFAGAFASALSCGKPAVLELTFAIDPPPMNYCRQTRG
jgi:acetolactate synthase-1/2/3 large subunit